MRLSPKDKELIIACIGSYLRGNASLYLYGSRADDTKRGGDIDLLVITKDPSTQETIANQKHRLLNDLKKAIGDQKIDLSILSEEQLHNDPFFRTVLPTATLLGQWGGSQ